MKKCRMLAGCPLPCRAASSDVACCVIGWVLTAAFCRAVTAEVTVPCRTAATSDSHHQRVEGSPVPRAASSGNITVMPEW